MIESFDSYIIDHVWLYVLKDENKSIKRGKNQAVTDNLFLAVYL